MKNLIQNKVFLVVVLVVILALLSFKFIYQKNISKEPKVDYMTEALKYKSQGDAGDKNAYYQAIESYKKSVAQSNNTIWLPYLNMGNVYKLLGDYANAEKAYDDGLKIAKDTALYLAKIELYQSFIKKPFADIQKLYDEALASTVENATLYINYASFLKETKHYVEALDIYKMLSKSYPDNQGYKDQIIYLEAKIK